MWFDQKVEFFKFSLRSNTHADAHEDIISRKLVEYMDDSLLVQTKSVVFYPCNWVDAYYVFYVFMHKVT